METLIEVVGHIGHVAVTVFAEPLSVAIVIVAKVDVGGGSGELASGEQPEEDDMHPVELVLVLIGAVLVLFLLAYVLRPWIEMFCDRPTGRPHRVSVNEQSSFPSKPTSFTPSKMVRFPMPGASVIVSANQV